jgi:DNA-binding LacI/PurR family transcriptional regulator/DNA-binding transcriptional regulator YhcF (GntR family)
MHQPSRRGRFPVYTRIAEELKRELAASPDTPPPSIAALAAKTGVSLRTAWKAVNLLIARGFLIRVSATRTMRAGSVAHADAQQSPAVNRLTLDLRRGIEDGSYRIGDPLPKTAWLASRHSSSPNTIAAAMSGLRRAGLVHKKGKAWIVGPSVTRADFSAAREAPVIMMLFAEDTSYEGFFSVNFVEPFARNFCDEIDKHGCLLSIGIFHTKSGDASANVPAGISEIRAHVMALGKRYRGAFVFAQPATVSDLGDHLVSLSKLGKPVVYFDFDDTGGLLTRSALGIDAKRCFRCHFDEPAAVALAVCALASHGHRTIGLPCYGSPAFAWTQRRIELLQAAIRPPCRLVCADLNEPFWKMEETFSAGYFLSEFGLEPPMNGSGGLVRRRSLRKRLLDSTPSLASLLDSGVTALVALNDTIARKLFLWLRAAEIAVPGKMSLISFDNVIDSRIFPIATIDTGFSRLGYLAAHLFIGDIPVLAGGNGDIAGPVMLVNRGTLAKAK